MALAPPTPAVAGVVACAVCSAPVAHAFCAQCGTVRPPDAKTAHSHLCRNCGHEADDTFCPHCGQETRIALPTAREFMREAAGRFVALDSRLWRTLAVLLARPGFLTNAYLAGRRLRYVRPARLFLFSSIVAFALVRLFAEPQLLGLGDSAPDGIAEGVAAIRAKDAQEQAAKDLAKAKADVAQAATDLKSAGSPPAQRPVDNPAPASAAPTPAASGPNSAAAEKRVHTPAKKANKPLVDVTLDDDDNTLIDTDGLKLSFDRESNLILGGTSPVVKPVRQRIDAFNRLSRDDKKRELSANAFRYGPYAAFALLPAFAFMLQLLYGLPSRRFPQRPRRFAAHLVFGAHNHAFLFVVISAVALMPHFSGRDALVATFACIYLLLSLRRVYGGSWIGILVRAAIIFVAYSVLFGLAVALLLVAAVLLR